MDKNDLKAIKYARTIKPYLKRMYAIVNEKKKLSKEFKDISERIKGLNTFLINDNDD
jgi:predicted  nucleic acid-binding Zn-ribbon protein